LATNQASRFPGVATDSAGNLYVADAGNARLLAYDGPFPAVTPTTTSTSTSTTSSTSTPIASTTTTRPPPTTTSTTSTTTTPPSTPTTSTTTSTTTTRPSITTSTTATTTTTTTTLLTVLPPSACPDAQAAAAIEAAIEAQCNCVGAANHGAFVRCATRLAKAAVKARTLPKQCKGAVKRCAARSVCGKPGFVTCCRTTAKGPTTCSTKGRGGRCEPPRPGRACVGSRPGGCAACVAGGCAGATAAHLAVP